MDRVSGTVAFVRELFLESCCGKRSPGEQRLPNRVASHGAKGKASTCIEDYSLQINGFGSSGLAFGCLLNDDATYRKRDRLIENADDQQHGSESRKA